MNLLYLGIWISVILCLGYLYIKWMYNYWKRHKIPFIAPKIPFGTLQVLKRTEHLSQRLAKIYHKYKNNSENSSLLGIYFFFRPVILVLDLDLVQHIFIKDFQHFQNR